MCNTNSITLTEIIWETFLKLTPLNRRVVSAVFFCFFFVLFFVVVVVVFKPRIPCMPVLQTVSVKDTVTT